MYIKKLPLVKDSHVCPCKSVSPSNTFNISSKLYLPHFHFPPVCLLSLEPC